ncbi:MAG: hypothetical protein K0U74_02070 [Alphaproteobacteria bacterium]|nr:hypothetical protein [Alphaproteobacteria bacterium]
MPSNFPKSLWWFVATAIIVLVQYIPVIGIIVIFPLMGALWSVATLNIGFLGIAIEVIFRRLNPAWLLLPFCWVAGYGAFYWAADAAVRQKDSEYRAANAGKSLPLRKHDVVLIEGKNVSYTAKALVNQHGIKDVTYFTPPVSRHKHYVRLKLKTTAECEELKKSPSADRFRRIIPVVYRDKRRVEGMCIVERRGKMAPDWDVKIEHSDQRFKFSRLLGATGEYDIQIQRRDGPKLKLRTGYAKQPLLFPAVSIGCALNWMPVGGVFCGARLLRGADRPLGVDGRWSSTRRTAILQATGLLPR